MPLTKPGLRSRVTPDGAMILDPAADEVITLNDTAGYIWARLEEGKPVEQIIEDVAMTTGHEPAVVAQDVCEFVRQLTAKHLLTL
jgi:hypothetical protein